MRTYRYTLFALAISAAVALPASALAPQLPPSGNFDLTHWKLQLPVDRTGGIDGSPAEVAPAGQLGGLTGYTRTPFFETAADGAMLLHCPARGAKTANTQFPRCELREMLDPQNHRVNWTVEGTHLLTARCKVVRLSTSGKLIVGQIHGITAKGENANPLVKLQFETRGGTSRIRAFCKKKGERPGDDVMQFPGVVAELGKEFDFSIQLKDRSIRVTVDDVAGTIPDKAAELDGSVKLDPSWDPLHFYFKAGNYNQDASRDDSAATVAFYALRLKHSNAN